MGQCCAGVGAQGLRFGIKSSDEKGLLTCLCRAWDVRSKPYNLRGFGVWGLGGYTIWGGLGLVAYRPHALVPCYRDTITFKQLGAMCNDDPNMGMCVNVAHRTVTLKPNPEGPHIQLLGK